MQDEATKKRFTFRQTKDHPTILDDLKKIAKKLDRSPNWIFEQALIEYLKKHKK